MYGNVEVSGSNPKGAVSQAIIFAAYLISLTILAILAVPVYYFVVIAVVGLPATGLIQAIAAYKQHKAYIQRLEAERVEQQELAVKLGSGSSAIQMQRVVNDDGLPVINL
jgi:hypothetical protein